MTPDEFRDFWQTLCGEKIATDDAGCYPQMPFNVRFASDWYRALQRYPLALCLQALRLHAASHHERHPALDTFIERVKALQPPPVQPWHQFAPAQAQAVRDAGYGGVLRSLLPAPGSTAWAKCWIWLFEHRFATPGREAEMAAECRRFADEYPADAADWLRYAARLYNDATEHPQRETPAQVGTLRQVSTPMGTRETVTVPQRWVETRTRRDCDGGASALYLHPRRHLSRLCGVSGCPPAFPGPGPRPPARLL